jgi:hypothetical protein
MERSLFWIVSATSMGLDPALTVVTSKVTYEGREGRTSWTRRAALAIVRQDILVGTVLPVLEIHGIAVHGMVHQTNDQEVIQVVSSGEHLRYIASSR